MSKRKIYNTNETKHYKMYKAGKQWFFAGLGVVSGLLGAGAATAAKADSVTTTAATNLDAEQHDDILATQDHVTIPSADSQASQVTNADESDSQSTTSEDKNQTSQSNLESQSQSESLSSSQSNTDSKSNVNSHNNTQAANHKNDAADKKKEANGDSISVRDNLDDIEVDYQNESGHADIGDRSNYGKPADINNPFNAMKNWKSFKGYEIDWQYTDVYITGAKQYAGDDGVKMVAALDSFKSDFKTICQSGNWKNLDELIALLNARWQQFLKEAGDLKFDPATPGEGFEMLLTFQYKQFNDHTAITGHDGTTTAGNPLTTKDLTDSVINADGSKGNVADVIMTSADPNKPLDWDTPGDYQVTLTYWDYSTMTSASVTVTVHVLDDNASTTDSTTESTTDSNTESDTQSTTESTTDSKSNTESNTESESMSKSASLSTSTSLSNSTSSSLSSSISAALANNNDGNNNDGNKQQTNQAQLPQTGEATAGLASTLGTSVLVALGMMEVVKLKNKKKSK